MKRMLTLLLLINIALLVWQCRKKTSDIVNVAFSKDCYEGKFTTALNQNEHIADIVNLPDNILAVLSSINNMAFIKTYDSHGRPMSAISVPLSDNAIAMGLIYTADGGYIFSSGNTSFISHIQYMPGYTNYYYVNNAFNPCNTGYVTTSGYISFDSKKNSSTCSITKVDLNGNVRWNKTFSGNFYSGSSLAMVNNNIYFMTIHSNLSHRIDSVSGTLNYLIYNYADSNSISLNNLDVNGNIIWSKQYKGITGIAIDQNTMPYFQGNIKASADNILLQSGYSVLYLNTAGKVLSTPDLVTELCGQFSYNGSQLFSIVLDSSGYDVFMPAYTGNGNGMLLQYDANSNLLNYFTTGNSFDGYIINMQCDNQRNILMYDGFSFLKYDKAGNTIFSTATQPASTSHVLMPNIFTTNCGNGYTLSSGSDALTTATGITSGIQLVKMDKYGHF